MSITNMYCALQDRLGAMDRVLLAFTHRGIIPRQIFSTHNQDTCTVELSITFEDADDARMLQKLVKALQKEVYVIDVRLVGKESMKESFKESINKNPAAKEFASRAQNPLTTHQNGMPTPTEFKQAVPA